MLYDELNTEVELEMTLTLSDRYLEFQTVLTGVDDNGNITTAKKKNNKTKKNNNNDNNSNKMMFNSLKENGQMTGRF